MNWFCWIDFVELILIFIILFHLLWFNIFYCEFDSPCNSLNFIIFVFFLLSCSIFSFIRLSSKSGFSQIYYISYCIIFYCIVWYCIVLYFIVLYCIVLYCIVLYCVLYYIVVYCFFTSCSYHVPILLILFNL